MSKIVLMGDSIIERMPENLIGNEDDEIKNFGIENICCETYHLYCWPQIKQLKADIYILLIGINNILMKEVDSTTPDTLDIIVNKLKKFITDISYKSVLLVQSIYPTNNPSINEEIKYINEKISEYCYELDIEYLDFYDLLTDKNGLLNDNYSSDGLHPNDECYNLIANQLNDYIKIYTKKYSH